LYLEVQGRKFSPSSLFQLSGQDSAVTHGATAANAVWACVEVIFTYQPVASAVVSAQALNRALRIVGYGATVGGTLSRLLTPAPGFRSSATAAVVSRAANAAAALVSKASVNAI
jgi:hypothetical protein